MAKSNGSGAVVVKRDLTMADDFLLRVRTPESAAKFVDRWATSFRTLLVASHVYWVPSEIPADSTLSAEDVVNFYHDKFSALAPKEPVSYRDAVQDIIGGKANPREKKIVGVLAARRAIRDLLQMPGLSDEDCDNQLLDINANETAELSPVLDAAMSKAIAFFTDPTTYPRALPKPRGEAAKEMASVPSITERLRGLAT